MCGYYAVVQSADPTMRDEGGNENKMTQRDLAIMHRSDRDNSERRLRLIAARSDGNVKINALSKASTSCNTWQIVDLSLRLTHCATDCATIVPWPITIHEPCVALSLSSAATVIPIAKGLRARFIKRPARVVKLGDLSACETH